MPIVGITGGVATGKSTFTKRLERWLPAKVFDADKAARDVLSSEDIVVKVASAFGAGVLVDGTPKRGIDRVRLREIVFRDSVQRAVLEGILHPLIRAHWTGLAKECRERGGWLLVDIPLLFETDSGQEFDRIVVVACGLGTQLKRLVNERGLPADLAEKIVASQQDLSGKVAKAGHVIWSDSPVARLEEQAQIFAEYLLECYG